MSQASTAAQPSVLRRIWNDHALSIVLVALFLGFAALQIHFGRAVYNEQREQDGRELVSLGRYLTSGHFVEALFENWESEFLQMGAFIMLAVKLRQKGSTESRPFDEPCESDEAIASVVVLSIFLRERGSPQSKPVAAPHSDTGG